MWSIRESVREGVQSPLVDTEVYLTMNDGAREIIEPVSEERPGEFAGYMDGLSTTLVFVSLFVILICWAADKNRKQGRVAK